MFLLSLMPEVEHFNKNQTDKSYRFFEFALTQKPKNANT
jgi:hypothetical protein